MTPSLLMAVLASGFIHGITPGPGVLAVFGIGAARGRRAGAGFLCGHLLGDVVWCSTALIAIVGARQVRSLYQRHELLITRLCGVMFISFAINALVQALPGLMPNKA